MQTIYVDRIAEVRNNKAELEEKLSVSIKILGKKVTIEGEALAEYEAGIVLDAIALGFSERRALLLTDPENTFRRIHIKKFTRRKDLEEVRARLIGTEGKTKRTLEEVGDCEIVIGDKEVGIIGSAEEIEKATTAITNLIRGSKQANVYRFLERINALNKKRKVTDILKKAKPDYAGDTEEAEETEDLN